MKSFSIIATGLFAALAAAAPSTRNAARTTGVAEVVFLGAADAYYSLQIRTDGVVIDITDPLSISHINVYGGACTFYGIDGSVTYASGPEGSDVGPPQTQVKGFCVGY